METVPGDVTHRSVDPMARVQNEVKILKEVHYHLYPSDSLSMVLLP